jgi:hypothetical protein
MISADMRPLRLALALLLTFACARAGQADGIDRRVPAGGDLQRALNEAQPGDRVILEPGATYVGNFVLPVHEGSGFVTLTTDPSSPELPKGGSRLGPQHASLLARIQSPNGDAALKTAPRAHHWRVQLVEFNGAGSSDIILLGDGGEAQRTRDDVPYELVIDRCYIHGTPSGGPKRGIALNSGRTSIIGSTISGIGRPGQDTQAIAGWNGPGPYLIENNRLEAGAENFMLGGASIYIPDLVPTDVTFRRNYVTKPLAWRTQKLNVKNLFELKNARRVLVELNVFENNWVAAQAGYAIVLSPRGDQGRAPWATVEDVTFRYNVIRHASGAFNVLGHDDTAPSQQLRRLRISHNLLYDIDGAEWGGSGAFLQIGDEAADIVVEHNTVMHTGTLVSAYGGSKNAPAPIRGFTFRNNLARHNKYGVLGSGRSVGNDTLSAFFPDADFSDNVLAGGKASLYPPDNLFPSVEEFTRQFVAPADGDFRLVDNSSFRRRASDGTDLGADVARISSGVADDERDRRDDREKRPIHKPGDSSVGAALVAGSFILRRFRP